MSPLMAEIVANGVLCAAGASFAAHAPIGQRSAAVRVALAWLLGCLCYWSAWFPPALTPHMLLGIKSHLWWAFCDTLAGLYIVEKSGQYWWGRVLFCTFVADVTFYVMLSYGASFTPLSFVIDYVGYFQAVIFVMIGARGCGNRITRFFDRWRHDMDTRKTVY